MIPVVYVLGGIGLRFVSKKLLQRAIAMGAKKAPKGFKGIIKNATKNNISSTINKPKLGPGVGRMASRKSNSTTTKNARTVKTRGGKVVDPKPTGSRTVKTREGKKNSTRPTDSKTLNKKSLLSGTAIGVVSTLNVKEDKKEKPSKLTESSRTVKTREGKVTDPKPKNSRTVKTREGKGNTVDKSKTSPKPKLRPKDLKKPAAGPVSDESFGAVFKRNRKANKATFTFKDKLYTTRIKEESIAEHKKKFGVKGKYK